ncbi:MAG TPA: proton-conducting transporter membrane subunit, partial [Candidatus Ozemobacteraceae bacterium]|nr:proton-conducting transporter membrane subunit [Candidatus Ozemobacteraceae bacterium]
MLTTLITALTIFAGAAFLPAPVLVTTGIAMIASLTLWGLGGSLVWSVLVNGQTPDAWGIFYLDRLGGFFLGILVLVGGAVLLNVAGLIRAAAAPGASHGDGGCPKRSGDVPLSVSLGLTLLFLLFMMLGLCSRNLGVIWVCVEGTTMVSALLIGFEHQRTALEAAWKYIILCTVGLSFSLLGLILLVFAAEVAGAVPTLDPVGLAVLAPQLPPALLKLAFLLILVGFGTKAGFAPLHSWLPDAHSQAPAPTSALLSAVLLNCSVYAIIRAAGVMSAAG